MWIKPTAEQVQATLVKITENIDIFVFVFVLQTFLYGNHILKNGVARMTENTPQYEGVVVFSSSDIPLVWTCITASMLY